MSQLFQTPLIDRKCQMANKKGKSGDTTLVMCRSGFRSVKRLGLLTYQTASGSAQFVLYWDPEESIYTLAESKSGKPVIRIYDTSGGVGEVAKRAEKILTDWSHQVGVSNVMRTVKEAQGFLIVNDNDMTIH